MIYKSETGNNIIIKHKDHSYAYADIDGAIWTIGLDELEAKYTRVSLDYSGVYKTLWTEPIEVKEDSGGSYSLSCHIGKSVKLTNTIDREELEELINDKYLILV